MATGAQLKDFLAAHDCPVHVVSSSKGVFTAKLSYYIGANKRLAALKEKLAKVPGITIGEDGVHQAKFSGGAAAGSAKDSYVWVAFTLNSDFNIKG